MKYSLCSLSGKSYSGKSFWAEEFKTQLNRHTKKDWWIESFADIPKVILGRMFRLDRQQINAKEELLDSTGITVRQGIIKVATVLRESFGSDIWIKALWKYRDNQNWIISDLRFKEEYEFLKKKGSLMIRLECTKRTNEYIKDLISETDLDDITDWDLVLNTDLERKVIEKQIKEFILNKFGDVKQS